MVKGAKKGIAGGIMAALCRSAYVAARRSAGAPVMLAKKMPGGSFAIEARDGSLRTNVLHAHCINCAKIQGVVAWSRKFGIDYVDLEE